MRRHALRACFLLAFGVLLAGCEDAFRSKEAKAEIARIRERVTAYPASIDLPDEAGEPPLHVAVAADYRSLLDWLLARGADPGVRDRGSWTALHHAVLSDRASGYPVMRLLIERGVGVDSARDDGHGPLHLAAASMRADAVAFLLEAKADPNLRTTLGETPLHLAATPQPTARDEEVRRTIQLLVAHGGDVGARAANGATPLHRAALIGSAIAIRALLDERADANVPDGAGWTPLHISAVFGTAGAAEALLARGADPNRIDGEGRTPLWRALHAPAAFGSTARIGSVATDEVVGVLRRFGATDGG